MKAKFLLCICILSLVFYGSVQGKRKQQEKYVTLVEAYSQQTIPGMRRATRPPPVTHFIVVWESKQHPDAFFWRADTGLLSCSVVKVHKIAKRMQGPPMGIDYSSEKIDMNTVEKGDTLDVIPILAGTGVIAAGLPHVPDTTNTLFFETGGKHGTHLNWLHIDTIKKKHPIAMP